MQDTGVLLPDESTFTLPAAWARRLHPRRGGVRRPVVPFGEDARQEVALLLSEQAPRIAAALADPRSEPRLVRAAQEQQSGTADPLGAAVTTVLALASHRSVDPAPLVDAWAAEHGLAFAARAVVALFGIGTGADSGPFRRDQAVVRSLPDGEPSWVTDRLLLVADRLRALLAAADEESYRQAVTALGGCRDGVWQRVVVSYLVPGERAWVDDCLGWKGGSMDSWTVRSLLLCSIDSAEQLSRLPDRSKSRWHRWSLPLLATLAEGIGPALAPLVGEALDLEPGSGETVKLYAGVLSHLPTDEAFGMLLKHADNRHVREALAAASARYPVRALRLLAAEAQRPVQRAGLMRELLTEHVAVQRELVTAALPGLDAEISTEVAALVAPLLVRGARMAEAPVGALPPLLVDPPWARRRKAAPQRVLCGLPPLAEPAAAHWLEGERESWSVLRTWQRRDAAAPDAAAEDWDAAFRQLRDGTLPWYQHTQLLVRAPGERVRALLADWSPGELREPLHVLRPIAAVHEGAALPALLRAAQQEPARAGELLLPFRELRVARVMADWLVRLKAAGGTARAWFARHGLAGVRLLIPDAVGPLGPERRRAEQALRLAVVRHGAPAVLELASGFGPEAGSVVAELLAADPLAVGLPARMPVPGAWADPGLLPQIELAGGGALPDAALRHVLTMLAVSKPGMVYGGIAVLRESCDPSSLAEFGWALFDRWRQVGMPPKDSWVLPALAWLGDDGTARRLTGVVRAWPGQGVHARAAQGLEVLALFGTDTALRELHGIAQRPGFKSLRSRAQGMLAGVAADLDLTADQLADRLVPHHGLDADGSTVIDYGPRRFTVGFDELLRPYVLDPDGTRRRDLPTPGAQDDQRRAPLERRRFATLKKNVRTTAAEQVRRLEAAMVGQRCWTAAEFHELFVLHPLLGHLVRRLVWQADGVAFRVAEDRTCADVEDRQLLLPERSTVRLAHPLLLGAELDAWSELLADYELLQPFPQLERPFLRLTEEEAAGGRLTRFEGATVPAGRLLGLERRGWQRGEPLDGGVEQWISRPVGPDRHLVIAPNPGLTAGPGNARSAQTLETVWLDDQPGSYRPGHTGGLRLGDLDPVIASEVLVDLAELVG